jgi:hypothetical protein
MRTYFDSNEPAGQNRETVQTRFQRASREIHQNRISPLRPEPIGRSQKYRNSRCLELAVYVQLVRGFGRNDNSASIKYWFYNELTLSFIGRQ